MAKRSPLSQALIKLKPQLLQKPCLMGVRLDTLPAKVHTALSYQERKSTAGHFSSIPELSAEGAAEVNRLQDKPHRFAQTLSFCLQVSWKYTLKTAF